MIPRTLVPTDVRPFTDNGDKKPPRRLTTYMDDRTVVPSDLSDAPPLTGKTNIPEHLPLDVLIERSLVPRGMGVKPFQQFLPPSEFAPLAILDQRVVVPAYVEPPEQREIDKFDQPPQMTAELREIVEPDIFNTGEANLLVQPDDRRDAKWDAITRVISVAAHIAFVIFLIFLPKIFPTHVPTRDEIELASKELGVVYLPPDEGSGFAASFASSRPCGEDHSEGIGQSGATAAGRASHRSTSGGFGATRARFACRAHAKGEHQTRLRAPRRRRRPRPTLRRIFCQCFRPVRPATWILGYIARRPAKLCRTTCRMRSSVPRAVARTLRRAQFPVAVEAAGAAEEEAAARRRVMASTILTPTEGVDFQ